MGPGTIWPQRPLCRGSGRLLHGHLERTGVLAQLSWSAPPLHLQALSAHCMLTPSACALHPQDAA